MRNINLRYIDETYDENGLLETYKVHYPDNFNFGYDIVDDIAINDPNMMDHKSHLSIRFASTYGWEVQWYQV